MYVQRYLTHDSHLTWKLTISKLCQKAQTQLILKALATNSNFILEVHRFPNVQG